MSATDCRVREGRGFEALGGSGFEGALYLGLDGALLAGAGPFGLLFAFPVLL